MTETWFQGLMFEPHPLHGSGGKAALAALVLDEANCILVDLQDFCVSTILKDQLCLTLDTWKIFLPVAMVLPPCLIK